MFLLMYQYLKRIELILLLIVMLWSTGTSLPAQTQGGDNPPSPPRQGQPPPPPEPPSLLTPTHLEPSIRFDHLTTDDGLVQNSISTILQDSQGFMLNDLEGMFYLQANHKQIHLSFERASNVPRVIRTDEVKLRQVLINLTNNTIKFTEAGSVTLRVESKATEVEGKQKSTPLFSLLHFEISDTVRWFGAPTEWELI